MTLNLTHLKSAADLAKTSPLNRDEWGEDIDPEDVLRLVEVARAAQYLLKNSAVLEILGTDAENPLWALLCPSCKGQGGGEDWIANENDRSGQSDYRAWAECTDCGGTGEPAPPTGQSQGGGT